MKVGILGSGVVGQSLGAGFAALGHDAKIGSRNLAMVWILHGFRANTWNHAFKLLRQP